MTSDEIKEKSRERCLCSLMKQLVLKGPSHKIEKAIITLVKYFVKSETAVEYEEVLTEFVETKLGITTNYDSLPHSENCTAGCAHFDNDDMTSLKGPSFRTSSSSNEAMNEQTAKFCLRHEDNRTDETTTKAKVLSDDFPEEHVRCVNRRTFVEKSTQTGAELIEEQQIGATISAKRPEDESKEKNQHELSSLSGARLKSGNIHLPSSRPQSRQLRQRQEVIRATKVNDDFNYVPEERAHSFPETMTRSLLCSPDVPSHRSMDDSTIHRKKPLESKLQSVQSSYCRNLPEFSQRNSRLQGASGHQSLPYVPAARKFKVTTPPMSSSTPSGMKSLPVELSANNLGPASPKAMEREMSTVPEDDTTKSLETYDSEIVQTDGVCAAPTVPVETSNDGMLQTDDACAAPVLPAEQISLRKEEKVPSCIPGLPASDRTRSRDQTEAFNAIDTKPCASVLASVSVPSRALSPASIAGHVKNVETGVTTSRKSDAAKAFANDNSESNEVPNASSDREPSPMEDTVEQSSDPVPSDENSYQNNRDSSQNGEKSGASSTEGLERSRSAPAEPSAAAEPSSTSSSAPRTGQERRILRSQRRMRKRQQQQGNISPEGSSAAAATTVRNSCSDNSNSGASTAAAGYSSTNVTDKTEKLESLKRIGINCDEEEENELDLDEIRKENRRLKNAKLCHVCKDKDANRLFLPCAHLASCALCSPALTKCPQCDSNVRGIVSVFFG